MALLNQLAIKGKLIINENTKKFSSIGQDGKTFTTTFCSLLVPQFAGQGKGYNGGNWNNVFFSLSFYDNLDLQNGQEVIVVGELKQNQGKDGKMHTQIKAQNIFKTYGLSPKTQVEEDLSVLFDEPKELTQDQIDSEAILFED